MLRPQIASRFSGGIKATHPGAEADPRRVTGSDRAMDVLQYGMAILAFAVALILAGLH
jgi:hypothetical protein